MPAASDELQFKNLKVLSPTITHDEMIATMRGFARALGTRCEHCHVQTAGAPRADQFDFPNDSKPEKRVARTMIAMTRAINTGYLAKVNEHGQSATCLTCHRGHTVPDTAMPQQERRPGAPAPTGQPAPADQPAPTPPPPPPPSR